MTLLVDTTNVVSDGTSWTGTSTSTSVTVGASDNLLLVTVAFRPNNGVVTQPPDTFTYNGVSLTLLQSTGNASTQQNISVWYLKNPPTGTHTLAGTWTTNTSNGSTNVTATPFSGADTTATTFGTPVTSNSTASNNPTITLTGGSAGSLDIATVFNGIAVSTSSGTGQTDVAAAANVTFGSSSNDSQVTSKIAGGSTANFAWTGSGSLDYVGWSAIAVNINASAGGGSPILMGAMCL